MTFSEILGVLLPWAVAILGVGGIASLFKVGVDRRRGKAAAERNEADATRVITQTAIGLLEPLKEQVGSLTDELRTTRKEATAEAVRARAEQEALRNEVHELRGYIDILIEAIKAAGLPIPATPDREVPVAVRTPRRRRT